MLCFFPAVEKNFEWPEKNRLRLVIQWRKKKLFRGLIRNGSLYIMDELFEHKLTVLHSTETETTYLQFPAQRFHGPLVQPLRRVKIICVLCIMWILELCFLSGTLNSGRMNRMRIKIRKVKENVNLFSRRCFFRSFDFFFFLPPSPSRSTLLDTSNWTAH